MNIHVEYDERYGENTVWADGLYAGLVMYDEDTGNFVFNSPHVEGYTFVDSTLTEDGDLIPMMLPLQDAVNEVKANASDWVGGTQFARNLIGKGVV